MAVEVPADASASSVVELLAQRIVQRSLPVPIPMTPEAIRERLGRALGRFVGTRDPRRRRTFGRLAYALMATPEGTNAQLAAEAGISPQALQRAADVLAKAGLLTVSYRKNIRYQGLSETGEIWLLPHAQGTAPAH